MTATPREVDISYSLEGAFYRLGVTAWGDPKAAW